MKRKVAIIGSGNIGTDLMMKILKGSDELEMAAMVGIDPDSDGLKRARELGVATTHEGLDGLRAMDVYPDVSIVMDATSAYAHEKHHPVLVAGPCSRCSAELIERACMAHRHRGDAAVDRIGLDLAGLDQPVDGIA